MSELTEKALEKEILVMLGEMPLKKITIRQLTERCGINRMTFYYHFRDIYDLLERTMLQVLRSEIGEITTQNWEEAYTRFFRLLREHQSKVMNIWYGTEREWIEHFLNEHIYRIAHDIVLEDMAESAVSEEGKSFISDFFRYGIVGMTIVWIESGMKRDPSEIVRRSRILMKGAVDRVIELYPPAE